LQIYATLYHEEIIYEENAPKIVKKNTSTDGEVISKIKVIYFLLEHGVYMLNYGYVSVL